MKVPNANAAELSSQPTSALLAVMHHGYNASKCGDVPRCGLQALAIRDAPNPPQAKHVRHCYEEFIRASIRGRYTLSMKAPIKKFKRKRDPGMSFGELVQRLWQPESEEPERKAARAKKKQSAGTPAQIRKK